MTEFFIRKKVGVKGDALGVTFPLDVLAFMDVKNQDFVKLIPWVDENGKHKLVIEKDTEPIKQP